MSLRLIPALLLTVVLGAADFSPPPRHVDEFGRVPLAAEKGRYVIGGFVEGRWGAVDEEEERVGGSRWEGFDATAGLEGMVRLVPAAWAVASVAFSTGTIDELTVDQAYVYWQQDQTYIRLGRTHQWFGWERFDAPELWRINKSYTYYNSGSLDGGTLGWRPARDWRLEASAANDIITPRDRSQGKDGTDLGYGGKLRWEPRDGRTWDLTVFYDHNTAPDLSNGGYGDVLVFSTWGEWRHINASRWSAAFDSAWADNPDGWQLFALAALRCDGELGWPGFTTLMATWLDERYDSNAIAAGAAGNLNLFDNQRIELAWAVMAFPTGDRRYRVGMELRALDSTVRGEDEYAMALNATAVLP